MGREIELFLKFCKNVIDKMEFLICKEKIELIYRQFIENVYGLEKSGYSRNKDK